MQLYLILIVIHIKMPIKRIFSPLMVLLLFFLQETYSSSVTDLEALLAFKKAIHNDPLGALSSWNETTHFCRWNGVSCSKRHQNRVVSVSLPSQGLLGSLSPHIGNLSFLRYINLLNNTFRGQIPEEIGRLRRLRVIEFSKNSLGGGIPRNLSQCRNLYYLNLIENQLVGSIVPEIGSLVKLKTLGLTKNTLSGTIPPFLGNLTSLTQLLLGACSLQGDIPSSIGNLINLTILSAAANNLRGPIPSSIGKLHKLQEINLEANRLTNEMPFSFGNLTLLSILKLGRNHLSGNIPQSLGNCTYLLELNLAENNLNGLIPPEIMRISTISISLNLSYNDLIGTIPLEVGALRNLGDLDLSHNRLSGFVPSTLSSCVMLERLGLGNNYFRGDIPNSLEALRVLQDLDLSRNNFSGMIPSFLSQLHLLNLNLSFNALYGKVPEDGVFQNESAVSLEGNRELCGGIAILNLPSSCPSTNSEEKDFWNILKDFWNILIPAGDAIILLISACLCVTMYSRRTLQQAQTPTAMFEAPKFLRLSYADLLNATSGFLETNLVGTGRFGFVYRGSISVDEDDEQTVVAVKVLNLNERGASRSLVSECNALRDIRHRNLVKILSVCDSIDFKGDGFKALVYEFMANGSLENWLHQNSDEEVRILSTIQRLNIAIDIASAVEYLHWGTDSIIVHGDLKPSNILLDHDMVAHVSDFGLATIISNISQNLSSSDGSSCSTTIKGTIGYIPPEYGMNNIVSPQGDAYSYGILLLEMFTNRRPTSDANINLHDFVSNALPDSAMEAVDSFLHQEFTRNYKYRAYIVSILSIGVRCSKQLPRDRMSMVEVVNELKNVRNVVLARNHARN